MTVVLDIKMWQWSFPSNNLYQPFPRSFAVASLVNNTKMAYGLGNVNILLCSVQRFNSYICVCVSFRA